VFILAGHAAAFAVGALAGERARLRPLTGRAHAAWAAAAVASLAVYAKLLPKLGAFSDAAFRSAAGGYSPFSADFWAETARGLAAGFGAKTLIPLLPFAAIGAIGLLAFLRRNISYGAVLLMPLFVTAGYLLARGYHLTPRFFLWAIPVAWIFTAASSAAIEEILASRSAAIGRAIPILVAAGFTTLSLLSLPGYYATPKQPNRTSLEWVLSRRVPGEPVVAAHMARWGLRFYGPPKGLTAGESSFEADDVAQLLDVERASDGKKVWLLTTFSRGLRLGRPELDRYVHDHYREEQRFPATIGDASVTVWTRETPR
jgi:hypothetical protein